jgi:hypothetical protein
MIVLMKRKTHEICALQQKQFADYNCWLCWIDVTQIVAGNKKLQETTVRQIIGAQSSWKSRFVSSLC